MLSTRQSLPARACELSSDSIDASSQPPFRRRRPVGMEPPRVLRNLGFIGRVGCRACLSDAYSYARSLYICRSGSRSVDILFKSLYHIVQDLVLCTIICVVAVSLSAQAGHCSKTLLSDL